MAYAPCRNCGEIRKHGDFITDDGSHVPACVHCGDPEFYEPLNSTSDADNADA